MNICTWPDKAVKKLSGCDMPFIKISLIAFAFMVAKLWQVVLNLDWYWYGVIFVLAMIKPMTKICSK